MRSILAALLLITVALPVSGEGYPDSSEVAGTLSGLAGRNDHVVLSRIGTSLDGAPLFSIRVALPAAVPAEGRPRLLVVAGLSPDHRIGVAVATRLAQALLDRAKEDPDLAGALASFTVEIIPLLNPDGLAALTAGPRREARVNTRPVDEDRDGMTGEDPPEDLNGDGIISLMRVREPAGDMRESGEDERLLVPADRPAGERGMWRVLSEGIDNDGDGKINEDGPGGVDLDRNFAHGWDRRRRDAGRSCPSEPESRALIDHVLGTPQVAAVLVYGHEESLASVPAANSAQGQAPPTGPHAGDLGWLRDLSARFKEICGATGSSGAQSTGSFRQWAYYQAGLPAFSTPLWYLTDEGTPFKLADGNAPTSAEGRLLALAAREEQGFIEWLPYEHPTLGVVEIGGFDPLFTINPPPRLIAPLVARQVGFITALLRNLPRPVLSATATPIEGSAGVYEVKLSLVNEGVIPAITAMGRTTRVPVPLRLELDLAAERVLQGRTRNLVDRLDGGQAASFRWLIRGKPEEVIRIRLFSARCGDSSVEVRL